MKIQTFLGEKGRAVSKISLALFGMVLLSGHGMAQSPYTLTSGGSTAIVDATAGQAGMTSWKVDSDPNQNQLALQWFYYSINGGPVQSIDEMPLSTLSPSQPDAADLSLDYYNSQVSIDVSYTLSGGPSGSGNADIAEGITIDNLSSTPFNIQFYQYSHFTLLQNPNSVTVYQDPNEPQNTIEYDYAEQTAGATALAEGIIAPDANYAEAGSAAQVLSDIEGGHHLSGPATASGDVAWSFEWDATINGGGEFDIAKDKELSIAMVPEPSSMALIALGLGACGFVRRAWKRNV